MFLRGIRRNSDHYLDTLHDQTEFPTKGKIRFIDDSFYTPSSEMGYISRHYSMKIITIWRNRHVIRGCIRNISNTSNLTISDYTHIIFRGKINS